MRRYLKLLPILAAALMFYFTEPMQWHSVYAQDADDSNFFAVDGDSKGTPATGNIQTAGSDGTRLSCDSIPEAQGGVLLGRIIPCLVHTIETASTAFSQKMLDLLRPMVYSFFTIVVVFFGVQVLQGEHQIGSQAFALAIKMAFVIGIMEMIPGTLIPGAYGAMADGVSIVTTAFGADASSMHCEIDKYGGTNTPMIWKQMDCMMGKLYGFATGTSTSATGGTQVNMLLASSAIGLLTGFFFGGTLGVTVFFALIGVLWTVAMLIVRVALSFLNGYLIVCLLLITAPLFLPLVLMKITAEYFEKWWKAILGGLMLPIIISAFSMFALYAYDQILFEPNSPLQELFKIDEIKDAMQLPRRTCDANVTGNANTKANKQNPSKDEMDLLLKNPFLQNFAQPLLSASSDACSMIEKPIFDVSKVNSPAYQDKKKVMVDIFLQCIKLLIMAFLISEGVETVEHVVSSFTGSSLSATALTARSQFETGVQQSFQKLKSSLAGAFDVKQKDGSYRSGSGADFIKTLPTAGKAAMTDFMSSMVNKR